MPLTTEQSSLLPVLSIGYCVAAAHSNKTPPLPFLYFDQLHVSFLLHRTSLQALEGDAVLACVLLSLLSLNFSTRHSAK